MSDSVTILAAGAKSNVATVYSGVTPLLAGFQRGRVPLESQVKGDSVDVSMYTQLSVDLTISAITNKHGGGGGPCCGDRLFVSLEHLVGGRWQLLHEFPPMSDPTSAPRAVLSAIGTAVRASWYWSASDPSLTIINNVQFAFGVAAECLPEA